MERAAVTTADGGQADAPELLRRFARGDADAFDAVATEYAPRVTRLAYRLLGFSGSVDDVVQDVFLIAFERAGKLRNESSLWTWLAAITLNRCRDQWRRRRLGDLARKFLAARSREVPPADLASLQSERDAGVREAVAKLPMRYREVVVLYYLQEMRLEEICEIVGASRTAVEVRLHRARGRLRELLAGLAIEE